jgi:hypothetical protein
VVPENKIFYAALLTTLIFDQESQAEMKVKIEEMERKQDEIKVK